jgi:hypothetical protein
MNSHAVAVERAMKRVVLQSLHAAFSVGTIAGAFSGAAAIALRVTPLGFLSGVAAVAEVVCLVGTMRLLPAHVDVGGTGTGAAGRGPRGAAPWTMFVVVLGFVGAGCMMAGGMAETWDGVFLRNQRHAVAAVATIGYLLFTVAQFAGRLIGDRLHRRWGSASLVRRGAILAAAGLLLQLTGPGPYWSMAGIAVFSLGLSVLQPIIFGAVGHGSADKHGGATVAGAIARFTTISYLGYLLGPASIGWLAEGVGLTWAMASVFIILAGVIAASPWTTPALIDSAGARPAEPRAAAVLAAAIPEESAR